MPNKTDSTPKRLIRMRLPVALIEVIEAIGAPFHRKTGNAIEVALLWAAWSYTHGRNPEKEMMALKGGYLCWDKKIRKRREVAELEKLFGLSGPTDEDDAAAAGVR